MSARPDPWIWAIDGKRYGSAKTREAAIRAADKYTRTLPPSLRTRRVEVHHTGNGCRWRRRGGTWSQEQPPRAAGQELFVNPKAEGAGET